MLQTIQSALIKAKVLSDPKAVTVHPGKQKAIAGKTIEFQFTAGGRHFYKLAHDYEMPIARFRFAKSFYEEVENRVTHADLMRLVERGQALLDEGKLGKTWQLLDDLKYQLQWAFEPDSLLRLGSVIYFDLKENLEEYDSKYNAEKIRLFKKKEVFKFLLTKLMSGSAILSSLSGSDLDTYLTEMFDQKEQMLFTEGVPKARKPKSKPTGSTTSTPSETKEPKNESEKKEHTSTIST